MLKRDVEKSKWTQVEPAYSRDGKQFYYLNVLPKEEGEDIILTVTDVYDHEPTEEDKTALIQKWTNLVRRAKLIEIENYDKSDNVNKFSINDTIGWYDKATRVGLANSIAIEKATGGETTVLYLGGESFAMTIEQAEEILQKLELYAISVYRKTQYHKETVNNEKDADTIENYHSTDGYPKILEFSI